MCLLLRQVNMSKVVIPGLPRNPVLSWIPASAGMTKLRYMIAGVIKEVGRSMTFLYEGDVGCYGLYVSMDHTYKDQMRNTPKGM
jgi:hypothetical protein